jgi:hypothetical protein
MDEIEEDLDSSWAEAAEFQDNYEREVMEEIRVFFIYMDAAGALEKITKAVEKVVDGGLSKERLLHLIQSKRHVSHRGGVKYRFMDLLVFHIPLEPGELDDFIKREARADFLNNLAIFDSIVIDPSIFIFHDVNTLFLFFKEAENVVVKSILKNGGEGSRCITKKVRITSDEYFQRKKKSLKRMMHRLKMTRKNV